MKAAEFDEHRLSTFASKLQEQQVQTLAAWGHVQFPKTCKQTVKCL